MASRTVIGIVVAIVIVIVALVISWVVMRRRRRAELRRQFGPEYDRTVRERGVSHGETVLLEREKRLEKFPIRELAPDERERFIGDWRRVQSKFVDDPPGAVSDADVLVTRLMQTRGYPMTDFEQRAADISVHYPRVVDNYRAAHEIALRHSKGEATTEDLRNSMIYYRSLFEELLQAKHTSERKEIA